MRTIAVVTVARSDFGLYVPLLRAIEADPQLRLHLIVTGAHFSRQFGTTVDEITEAGIAIGDRVDMLLEGDSPEAISKSMGLGTLGMAQVLARGRPDVLVVLGDRFEMHAAVVAAVPFKIPIAHLHGGEVTAGAIDDAFRHAITKYAHLHFVASEEYGRRVVQLGEEPWRVTVSGAPGLDQVLSMELLSAGELSEELGLSLDPPPLLVTYHPVTLQYERTEWQTGELLAALDQFDRPVVITKPNADTNGRVIIEMIEEFARRRPRVRVVDNLGTRRYFSLMRHAAAMVGNSSSGIGESASFELPVVNVGIRQQGRTRQRNILDVDNGREAIAEGIRRALDPSLRASLTGMTNIYGTGHAAATITERLRSVPLDDRLLIKRFYDVAQPDVAQPDVRRETTRVAPASRR